MKFSGGESFTAKLRAYSGGARVIVLPEMRRPSGNCRSDLVFQDVDKLLYVNVQSSSFNTCIIVSGTHI